MPDNAAPHLEDASTASVEDSQARAPKRFVWRDANNVEWTLLATSDTLSLQSDDEHVQFERATWREAIAFSPMGSRVVLRFDLGEREVGFMVPVPEAHALFTAMGKPVSEPPPEADSATADPSQTPHAAPTGSIDPLWPKMTLGAVVGFTLAVLSFLPGLGLLLGVFALLIATLALRKTPDNVAHAHIRKLHRLTLITSGIGMAISVLALYTYFNRAPTEIHGEEMFTAELEWNWIAKVAALAVVLVALSIHEAAHAITAWWCGDGLAKALGRVTLNPLAHIDLFGTILLPILLMSSGLPVFGYAKPVPTRLDGVPRRNRAQILVAAAGPFSNLLQAAIGLAIILGLGCLIAMTPGAKAHNLVSFEPVVQISGIAGAQFLASIALLMKLVVGINVMLAFFNLIPIPPLDGSWIAQNLSPRILGPVYAAIRPFGFLIFVALISFGGKVLMYFMYPALVVILSSGLLVTFITGFA